MNKITTANNIYNLLLAFCLLTKILLDFLFGLYLLNLVIKHATTHSRDRCQTLKNEQKTNSNIINIFFLFVF
jgi:hypothetical protein